MHWFVTCCVTLCLLIAGTARSAPDRDLAAGSNVAITVAKRLAKLAQRRVDEPVSRVARLAPTCVVARFSVPRAARPAIAIAAAADPAYRAPVPAGHRARGPPIG